MCFTERLARGLCVGCGPTIDIRMSRVATVTHIAELSGRRHDLEGCELTARPPGPTIGSVPTRTVGKVAPRGGRGVAAAKFAGRKFAARGEGGEKRERARVYVSKGPYMYKQLSPLPPSHTTTITKALSPHLQPECASQSAWHAACVLAAAPPSTYG